MYSRTASPTSTPRTLGGLVVSSAERFGDAEALVDVHERLSYAEVRARASRVSAALLAAGMAPGDRVALWAPNSVRWAETALGIVAAGCVLVPINTRYRSREARDIIGRSGARMVFTEDGFLDGGYVALLRGGNAPARSSSVRPDWAGHGLPAVARVVTLDRTSPTDGDVMSWGNFREVGRPVSDEVVAARWAAVGPDDVADVLFTSGTSGSPKGALSTHLQNVRTYRAWSARTGLREGDRYLVVNPLFHAFGYKAGLLASLICGAVVVFHEKFDATEAMRTVARERITVFPGPPTVYTTLLDAPDRRDHDLSTLRLAVTGAQPVPVALVRRIRDELCPQVLTAYGMTETAGTVTVGTLDDTDEAVSTTSGRAIDGIEVRVVDDHGRDRASGEDGEILVRGFNVMMGYLDDPAATADAIQGGWLHTGDLGRLDEAGYLTITGRAKDMFTMGGFNVYPAEVESVLASHPDVSQAAVIGVPDPRMGEVGHAVVVLRSPGVVSEDALSSHCRQHLANFKVPRTIKFDTALPLNATGKVDKLELARSVGLLPTDDPVSGGV